MSTSQPAFSSNEPVYDDALAARREAVGEGAQQGLRALIIDDNPDDRLLAIRTLQRAMPTMTTMEISTQDELTQALETGAFDAVVTDYMLHWSTGLDVLAQVKARYPDRPVIMFTNTETQEIAVEAMKRGLDDYVVKAAAHFLRLPIAVQAALERANARRDAQAALAARERFLIIAAHELRTPLTTINGSLGAALNRLRRVLPTLPEEGQAALAPLGEALERARRQAKRLDRLQENMLVAAQVATGALPLRATPLDIIALAGEVVSEQREVWPNRQIELVTPDADEQIIILADADHIHQVVANLLANALKFSESEQPVTVTVALEGASVRVSVTDKGYGIPPAEQARIFDRFYRAADISHLSGSSVGLGLGLSINRAIIEQSSGTTGVESALGHGSTFWFALPLLADAGEVVSDAADAAGDGSAG